MAKTINRRLAELIDGSGQLQAGKIANSFITTDHYSSNSITDAKLHTSFALPASALTARDTGDLSEGSNQYFTNTRVQTYISGNRSYGGITASGTHTFTANDVDFIVQDTTDSITNYIWRHHGNSALYLGSQDAIVNIRSPLQVNGTQVFDTSRNMSNVGTAVFNGAVTLNSSLNVASTVGIAGTTVIDSSRNLTNIGNITTTGYIAGPATFTIDPSAVGDNTGTVVIAGNLQVDGTTTTINSTTLEVDDLNITLGAGSANSGAANGAGITVDIANNTNPTLLYNGTLDSWDFNKSVRISSAAPLTLIAPSNNADFILSEGGTNTDARIRNSNGILEIDADLNNEYGNSSIVFAVDGTDKLKINNNGEFTLSSTGTVTLKAAPLGSTYGAGFNAMSVTGTSNAPYTSTIGFSNYGVTDAMVIKGDQVGIGTTSPTSDLSVGSTTTSSGDVTLRTTKTTFSITPSNSAAGGVELGLGWVSGGQGPMKFAIGGADKMTIDSSGKVGIGTTSPSHGLTVSDIDGGDNADMRRITIKSETHGVNSGFRFDSESANGTARGGGYYFQPGDTDDTTYLGLTATDAAYQMVITREGNVGIGNTSPTSNLTIGSAQSDGLEFTYDGTNAYRNRIVNYWNSSTDTRMDFEIGRSGGVAPTAVMSVGYDGKVGIGTSSPSAKLEVRGGAGGGTHTHAIFTGTAGRGLAIKSGQTGGQHNGKAILDAQDPEAGGASMDLQIAGTTKLGIENSGEVKIASGILTVKPTSGGGGQIGLGDWSNGNPIGISEGLWNTVATDNDFITVYARQHFNIRGYGGGTTHWLSLTNGEMNLQQNQKLQAGSFKTTVAGNYAENHLGVYVGGAVVNTATSQTGWLMQAGSGKLKWDGNGVTIVNTLFAPTIDHGETNVGAPNTANHATGTRQTYYDGSATAWYARGIESNTLWDNVDHDWKLYRQAVVRLHWDESDTAFKVSGRILPHVDNGNDLGSQTKRWANIYTGDLHLSNEGSKNDVDGTSGNWTIQEGEEHLYIINNKSGKKFKFSLEEVE